MPVVKTWGERIADAYDSVQCFADEFAEDYPRESVLITGLLSVAAPLTAALCTAIFTKPNV